jgi:hypothetical protein
MAGRNVRVLTAAHGTSRTSRVALRMSVGWGKADLALGCIGLCFRAPDRPFTRLRMAYEIRSRPTLLLQFSPARLIETIRGYSRRTSEQFRVDPKTACKLLHTSQQCLLLIWGRRCAMSGIVRWTSFPAMRRNEWPIQTRRRVFSAPRL